MSSSSSASSSSSSSSSSENESPRLQKRKRLEESEDSDDANSSDSDSNSDSASDSDASNAEDSDVPVLSHAEKRRQKKKQKPEGKISNSKHLVEGALDEQKPKSKAKPDSKGASTSQSRRQNSVWVGNLSYQTTPDSLRTFFAGVGEITRVHMPMKVAEGPRGGGKVNRGFAYVDFSSPDAKVIAIAMSEQHFEGRRLLIKDGDDFTGRPAPEKPAQPSEPGQSKLAQKILSSQKQPPAPTLFLGNLSFESTEESIREMLEAHRKVKPDEVEETADGGEPKPKPKWIRQIRVGTFEDSGHCKGWAFVDFANTEQATAVLINPRNHHLDGRKLVVEFASPDAVRRGGGGPPRLKDGEKSTNTSGSYQKKLNDGTRRFGSGNMKGGDSPDKGRKRVDDGGVDQEHGDQEAVERKPAGVVHGRQGGAPGQATYDSRPPRDGRGSARSTATGRGRPRAKPGAALAQAQRGSATIVPSQGQKIKF
ncbi:hypothetical protein JAAARDRAFT_117688 [Jaapia argillacea MUCL 33604]|uniref:RRM domain-containing protein n=1 Tax=Jaapia argillacea MUCL 33604 TaxID=933084 RepID=A0A067QD84_9AGAM|nr:hypothetical protein JAAARDRAFT_117688 [Jaapia argillacea MUCL 33604]